MQEGADRISALGPTNAEGAFYLFPSYKTQMSSQRVTEELLEKFGVAVIPGASFGPAGEGHVRLSFSVAPEAIQEGMRGIESFFKSHS